MDLNLVDLNISVRTDDPARLALCLPASGGAFAAACRNVACRCPTSVCQGCSSRADCPWHAVFAQALSSDPAALRRHQKPPLPFVFSFPSPDKADKQPGTLDCGLVVVGRAIPHLGMLLEGFAELLAGDACQAHGEIIRLAARDYQGTPRMLGTGGRVTQAENMAVLSADGLLESRPWECSRITIRLLSPLRLVVDGRQLTSFDFSRFARSLMRRISSLAYYYADREFEADYRGLSSQTEAVVCDEERFGHGKAGITGYGSFSGDLSGLMRFLVLGTFLHAGKGASFGMGRYEILLGGE